MRPPAWQEGYIAIASQTFGWHEESLARAFLKLGWQTHRFDLSQAHLHIVTRYSKVALPQLPGVPMGVFVRGISGGSLEQIILRMNILHALQEQGCVVYNTPRAIERAVDKPLTSLLLAQAALRTPATWVGECRKEAQRFLEDMWRRGHKVVQKPLFGSQGRGLHLLSHLDQPVLDRHFAGVWYLQEFVAATTAPWSDIRVLVVAGQAVAAMRREGHGWITNRAQGGRCRAQPLSDDLVLPAIQATQLMDMDYAGVDLIQDQTGQWQLLELNSMPAWRGLEQSCRLPVSEMLAKDCARKVQQSPRCVEMRRSCDTLLA